MSRHSWASMGGEMTLAELDGITRMRMLEASWSSM